MNVKEMLNNEMFKINRNFIVNNRVCYLFCDGLKNCELEKTNNSFDTVFQNFAINCVDYDEKKAALCGDLYDALWENFENIKQLICLQYLEKNGYLASITWYDWSKIYEKILNIDIYSKISKIAKICNQILRG